MAYWLAKSEADVYSIDDLARDGTTGWEGVRNFQARNYLRAMKMDDRVLFYQSNSDPLAVVGVAVVAREAYPDPFQFERGHAYEDPTSKRDDPRWSTVDLRFVEKLPHPVTLERIKADPSLVGMEVARRGSRLSVHPVAEEHFDRVLALGRR